MLAYTFYETDTRVIRYAESLVKRGDTVDAIVLRHKGQPRHEIINGVNVYRIQKREINEKGKFSYLARLLRFFVNSAAFITRRHLKNKYDMVHVHSVPDFEVFAALIPKLLGSRIILDIHDIVPEFYASKFNVNRDSLVFKLLTLVEKASTAFSDHVIIANHLWEKTITARSVKTEKCTALLNYPDPSVFHGGQKRPANGRFVMIYPGTLNWHQGVDIAVRAFAMIKDEAPGAEFRIYGEGSSKGLLRDMVKELGLEKKVLILDYLPLNKIAEVMRSVDLGVVPKRACSFGDEAYSTKILEFMAVGVPVLVSNTKIDRYYFDESLVKFFESGNEKDLADCMLLLIRDKALRERLVSNGVKYIEKNNWDVKQLEYFEIVDRIVGEGSGRCPRTPTRVVN